MSESQPSQIIRENSALGIEILSPHIFA